MAAETLTLEIVTPDGPKLREEVSELTAPSVDGEFGVLPRHRPMLAALATGIVSYVQEGQKHLVAVGPGFVEVSADKVTLLTDRFIKQGDVDPVRVRLDLKEADEQLDRFQGDLNGPEYAELVQKELWAAAQLELHGDPPPPRVKVLSELRTSGEQYTDLDAPQAEGEPPASGDHAA